jgi:hypothetical protein
MVSSLDIVSSKARERRQPRHLRNWNGGFVRYGRHRLISLSFFFCEYKLVISGRFIRYIVFSARLSSYTLTNTSAHLPYERTTRTHTLPLWAYLKNRVRPTNLKIDKITSGSSLSMDMSPTTAPLNLRINLEKYERSCQVSDLTRVDNSSTTRKMIYDRFTYRYIIFVALFLGFINIALLMYFPRCIGM